MATHTLPLPLEFHNGEQSLTIEIPLTKGYTAVVSAEDADLAVHKWSAQHSSDGHYYAARRVGIGGGKTTLILLHRLILERILGRQLERNERCDHEDLDRMNDTRKNLRLATVAQNGANTRRNSRNTSGYKGVSYSKRSGKWYAYIGINGKTKSLGLHDTAETAYEAYCKAAVEHFGEFARLE